MYPLGLDEFIDGDINYLTDTIKIQAVDAGYVFAAGHNFLDDITGRVHTPETLTNKSRILGYALCDPIEFEDVLGGETITGFVVYQDTGVEATSRLIAYIDRWADTVPISIETTDGDLTLRFADNRLFRFAT